MAESFQPPTNPPSPPPAGNAYGESGSPTQYEDVNVSLIAIVGVFSAVGLFLIVVLLQAWFFSASQSERDRKVVPYTDATTALGQMLAEQNQQLQTYHWVKPETQTRAIPIERAMDLVTAEMAASQQHRE